MAITITSTDISSLQPEQYGTEGFLVSVLEGEIPSSQLVSSSYIEYFVYDPNKNLVQSNLNFTNYSILNNGQTPITDSVSSIEINLEEQVIASELYSGEYILYFNFLNQQIGAPDKQLNISEISSDRTELRLKSVFGSVEEASNFINERENSNYFIPFYLNFGGNQLTLGINLALDNSDPSNPSLLVKLNNPLPVNFNLNSTLWVVTQFSQPLAYNVEIENNEEILIVDNTIRLSPPNFNLPIQDQINNSTINLSYNDLITTQLTSSFNQISSLLEEKEIDINIDYANFYNFTHFSSVKTRLENFYYKVSLIEQYSSSIAVLNNATNSPVNISSSISTYESKINNIITNFDGYDYYLYYSSGSWAWPKTNSQPPYNLFTTGSTTTLTWLGSDDPASIYYGGIILSASIFDQENPNNLYYAIPEYLRDDPDNDQYNLFINMVGQFYDNIWIYYKDVSEKYNADNRLEYGISKDIVADAIRDFGIKLYQNNFSNDDLYTAFLGLTPSGSLFPFPNITGSLPTPSGFEYVDVLISASNDYLPLDDVNKSLYKRIYHNLPYLLKSKGTMAGLRALITSYGIPDTILRINEYGGKDKVNYNDWDYWQDEFNYAFCTTGSNFISSSWGLNPLWNAPDDVPSTLMFRFKTEGLPTTSIPYSQSLWYGDGGCAITLTYNGTGYTSGSYQGAIIDPYYQYATLAFYPDITNSTTSASIYLPFFDGDWWSVMLTRSGSNFSLYSQDKFYQGGDNDTQLGFQGSSSITYSDTNWANSTTSYFPVSFSLNVIGGGYNIGFYDVMLYDSATGTTASYDPFAGCYQEIRYYNSVISKSIFTDYTMNPYSIEGNTLNESPNQLAFRATVAGELYRDNISVHPKVTGSWAITNSFINDSTFYYDSTPEFFPNTEYFFFDQPIIGIKNRVSDKIRVENNSMPSGDVLSPFRSLSQNSNVSQSYTPNNNYLEIAFSPQNEINDDITDQLGYFNIGEFIGDPRFRSSSALTYPELDKLRNSYFEKYTKNYNLVDFIRLIKFFDNSLFKMLQDFVPARTSLASGIVIKQHLLERNRYPQPKVNNHSTIAFYTTGSGSTAQNNNPLTFQSIVVSGTLLPQWNDYKPNTIYKFSGGTGGTFEQFNSTTTSPSGSLGIGPNNIFNITQSWLETTEYLSGSIVTLHDTQDEFYDGEFSGSYIIVTTQSLNQPYPINNLSSSYRPVYYYGGLLSEANIFQSNFLNANTSPHAGEILFDIGKTTGGFLSFDKWDYVKIAKTDCNNNDNTTPLGNINTLLIEIPLAGVANLWIKYSLTVLNEYSNYYLYKINNAILDQYNTPIIYASSIYPNQVFDYTVSSSVTASYNVGNGITKTIINWNSTLAGTNLPHYGTPYFNTSSGILTFENTPNTRLFLTASIGTLGAGFPGSSYPISLIQNRNNIETTLASQFYSTLGTTNTILTASFYPIQNDQYYIKLEKPLSGGSINITSAQLLLTQSRAVSASNCEPIILEPYITSPNFYNSDNNALLNNAEGERKSSTYMDVDYTPGILVPTNFGLIISGSALKAAVQDSNYTTKRHIIPRYLGSKSTSQRLNVWTPGDTGTYGKTPTVESLKVMVAYGDMAGGWAPEKMNTSCFAVKYLIDLQGNVIIPNVTENSLEIVKGTFESGEKFKISSATPGFGDPEWQYRTTFRAGTTINPILYTQIGHSPATWTSSIDFSPLDGYITTASIDDYTAKITQTNGSYILPVSPTYTTFNLTDPIYIGNPALWSTDRYIISSSLISDNVTLFFDYKFNAKAFLGTNAANVNFRIYTDIQIIKKRGALNTIIYSDNIESNVLSTSNASSYAVPQQNISLTLLPVDLEPNDEIFLQTRQSYVSYTYYNGNVPYNVNYSYYIYNTRLNVTQTPIKTTLTATSSIPNSIWGYPDPINHKNIITCSSYVLNQLYGTNVKQQDISGSGFNPISYPWSIEYGDEFRFEGSEDETYQVGQIYSPGEGSGSRLFESSSIEVHFNRELPVSASSSYFNLDHFLIRRYTNEATQIIFDGFKPLGSSGPYIITPEYASPELNKSIDAYIVDLTQKSLL